MFWLFVAAGIVAWDRHRAAYPRKNAFTAQLTFAPVATPIPGINRHRRCTRRRRGTRRRHGPVHRTIRAQRAPDRFTSLPGFRSTTRGASRRRSHHEETGFVQEFDLPMEYYHGTDDGEGWSEGNRSTSIQCRPVPAGNYTLRLELDREKMHESATSGFTSSEGGTAHSACFSGCCSFSP